MKTIVQSIEIPPTKYGNPVGEWSHMLRLSFKHEDEEAQGIMTGPLYCLYSRKNHELGPITVEGTGGAGEYALAVAFKIAETSRPDADKPPEIRFNQTHGSH